MGRRAALGQAWSVGDALGSVRQTLDGTGGVLAATSYDPWGVPQYGMLAPFGVTGELHAQERVYLRARWYDPGNGTFTSRDPFAGWPEQSSSLHPYQDAYSNPVLWTDPSGELAIFVHGGFGISEGNPSVYQMVDSFVNNGILDESEVIKTGTDGRSYQGIIGGVNDKPLPHLLNLADQIIQVHDQTCGQERIIIFGYSRGGVTAQLIAGAVFAHRPDVRIDLVATVAPIHYAHPTAILPAVDQKLPNVKRHINFLSEQGVATEIPNDPHIWPPPLLGGMLSERTIRGASSNKVIDGTSHVGIMARRMPIFESREVPLPPVIAPEMRFPLSPHSVPVVQAVEYQWVRDEPEPNPVWEEIGKAIQRPYRLYIPRIPR